MPFDMEVSRGEKRARAIHLALLGLIVAGLGAWLYRVYGFDPLEVKTPVIGRSAP